MGGTGRHPLEELLYGLEISSRFDVLIWQDEPFALWGTTEVEELVGTIWLLGTDAIFSDTELRFPFL